MTEKIEVYIDADIQDLIPGFLQNRENDVQLILEKLNTNDFEAVRVIGHSMKGSGSSYGFEGISKIGGAIEKIAQEQNTDALRNLVQDLSNYLDRLEVKYEDE